MQQQTLDLATLSDIELMAFRLETQEQLQVAQINFQQIEQETARRVKSYYDSRKKEAAPQPNLNGQSNEIEQKKVDAALVAMRDKMQKEAINDLVAEPGAPTY